MTTMTERKIAERPHQIVERVAEFIKQGDLEGVVSMFHPDCSVAMNPAGDPMVGHDGVREIFRDFVANRVNLKGSVSGEMINGDTAILQGEWTVEDKDGNTLGGGVSTEVAKQLDHGGWTYFIDCPISVPEPVRTLPHLQGAIQASSSRRAKEDAFGRVCKSVRPDNGSLSSGRKTKGNPQMKAAIYQETGTASHVLKIVDLERPVPKEGEVLVRLYASGVNPTDTKTRAGIFPVQGDWDYILPHHDGAGMIEAVGPKVPKDRIGERVWLHSAQWGGANGTAAEYVVAHRENAITLPPNVTFEEGATFGVPLLTAYHAVTMDGPVSGKAVLVQGGAGAVGNYAIQIAKQKGAMVIATVSSPIKAEAARKAGADHVINYQNEDVPGRVQDITKGVGVDHIVEVNLGANAMQLPGLIRNGGFVAAYGSNAFIAEFPMFGAVIQQMRFGFSIVFMLPREILKRATDDLTSMLTAGQLAVPIQARFPLEQIALAHDAVDSNSTIGNVVITV